MCKEDRVVVEILFGLSLIWMSGVLIGLSVGYRIRGMK